MDKEMQQVYSTRITQASPTELVVIVYELVIVHLEAACQAKEQGQTEVAMRELDLAQKFLQELMGSLQLQYSIGKQLFSIYRFVNKTIIEARFHGQMDEVAGCVPLLQQLKNSFEQIASKDHRGPVMANTQKLYAGLTYGKHALSEVSVDQTNGHRGLYA